MVIIPEPKELAESLAKEQQDKHGNVIWPMPGRCVVHRINKKARSSGVWVPRQEQEETDTAYVFHSGWNNEIKVGDMVIVPPHCGTDLELDGFPLTILDMETQVLGVVGGS